MSQIKSQVLELKWLIYNILFNFKNFSRTLSLKNARKGKKLFLFANGPSLNILCPVKIREYQESGFEVFAINSFIRSDFFQTVKPNYYHIADPAHFLDFTAGEISKQYQEFARIDHEMISGLDCLLFIPINQYNKISHRRKFPVTHLSNPYKKGIGNLFTAFGHSTMTAYGALHISLFLGFDHIYICGFDNSWFKSVSVDKSNNLYYDHNHFYDESSSHNKKLMISSKDGINLGHYLKIQQRLFSDLYRFKSPKISNLDPNSLTDAFSKNHDLDVYRNE